MECQSALATAGVNVRSGRSQASPVLKHLAPGDSVTLVSATKRDGYYHVRLGTVQGWAYARYIVILSDTVAGAAPLVGTEEPNGTLGSASTVGCGDGRWKHVYNPQRLAVRRQCVTVSGIIVDASGGDHKDGARHEKDGDTHSWLKLDHQFAGMLNAGNKSDENGNLVFEIVCHYSVTQATAKAACSGFTDHTVIPPIGSHVEITGSFVQDDNHAHWNEIHPVSKIVVKP
ncbi:MAG TPA: SH3 domain-containing protein [Gemmatimonadaceae bacterium]